MKCGGGFDIFSLSVKTVIGGYQESFAFGIISKEEDHGRLQVGEKKPQCDRRVVKSGKEDQRETTKSWCEHSVLVSCNKLMQVGLVLLVRIVLLSIDFFCDTHPPAFFKIAMP